MGLWKLRILLCVSFLVIVSIVALVSTYRTTPLLPSLELPRSDPIAIGTPLPPTEFPTPTPESANFVGQVDLIVPVAGVRPEQLLDTYADARSEGRTHDAILNFEAGGNRRVGARAELIVFLRGCPPAGG